MSSVSAGNWPDYRCDDSRLGIQPAPRSAGPLQLQSSLRIGGSYQEIVAVADGSGDLLMADGGGIQRVTTNAEIRWRTQPFGAHWITGVFDLDADGNLEIVTSNGRELIILSAETGEFLFRDDVGPPFSYGTYATMFQVHSFFGNGMQILIPCFSNKEVLMYDCSRGARNTYIQHRLWMDDGYHPSIAIGDVNGDGVDEIVIARLGGVYVFDPATGKLAFQTLWKSDDERRRNYGHFELVDIDGDGNLEAVILSDKVTRHIAILGTNGNGEFYPLWDRFIEHIYPNDTTELRFTSNSIRDLDGDGQCEIAISIYNESKDAAWHTVVLRATTGEVLLDLKDQYLRGIQDADADGLHELCLSSESERSLNRSSTISIYSVRQNKTIWKQDNARFCERAIHTKPSSLEFKPDVFASHEIWTADLDGRSGILIRDQNNTLAILDNDLTLHNTQYASSKEYRIAHCEKDTLYVTENDGNISIVTPEGYSRFLSCGYHLTTEAHIAARPGNTPTVATANLNTIVVASDFNNNIHLLRREQRSLTQVGNVVGRSRLGYDNVFHAASVIQTQSGPRLVVVDDHELNHSQLSLYSLSGECQHSYPFPEMPRSVVGNRIGCYDWLYFMHSRGEAMFASFYRSPSMNSESSLAFLLETDEVLWQIDRTGSGEHGRGVGAWGTSALQYIDGVPTAVFCAKDTLCHLYLENGIFSRPPKLLTDYTTDAMKAAGIYKEQDLTTYSSIDDPFTAYGTAIVNGDDLVIAGCFGGIGVLDENLEAKWWHIASFGDVLYRLPGIGDIDGDGKNEIGQSHADGSFRVYDYETGALRASLDIKAIATDALTIDANDDGKMEFVVGTNDGRLMILGFENEAFGILHQHQASAALGSPIAADIDGDGRSEILVISAGGNILSFK